MGVHEAFQNIKSSMYSGLKTPYTGIVKTVNSLTPTPIGGAWAESASYDDVTQDYSSGDNGFGLQASIVTDASGNPTFTLTGSQNSFGYEVGDAITFTDPGSTTNTARLVVASIGNLGKNSYKIEMDSATGDIIIRIDKDGVEKTATIVDFSSL